MAYPIVRIDPTTTTRERSPALWRSALDNYDEDRGVGTLRADDWNRARVDAIDTANEGWFFSECALAGADTEVFSTIGQVDGIYSLSAATDTDHEGVKMQGGCSAAIGEGIVLPSHATAANARGDVIFEARVYIDDDTNDTLVCGLWEQGAVNHVLSAASLLLDDEDYIGFYRIDKGDLQFVVRNDNAAGTAVEYNVDVASAATVAADLQGWVKLGFRVNADKTCEVFINGTQVKYSSETTPVKLAVTATSLPEVELSRTLGVARGATSDNDPCTLKSDWVDCFVQN